MSNIEKEKVFCKDCKHKRTTIQGFELKHVCKLRFTIVYGHLEKYTAYKPCSECNHDNACITFKLSAWYILKESFRLIGKDRRCIPPM